MPKSYPQPVDEGPPPKFMPPHMTRVKCIRSARIWCGEGQHMDVEEGHFYTVNKIYADGFYLKALRPGEEG